MSNHKHVSSKTHKAEGRSFYRPKNADIFRNLMSAFVPVVNDNGLSDGEHYMGGIVFTNCETQWFFDALKDAGQTEIFGGDVRDALTTWVSEDRKADVVLEEVKHIVITACNKIGYVIDLSVAYSLVKAYVEGWVAEIRDPERNLMAVESSEERWTKPRPDGRKGGSWVFEAEDEDRLATVDVAPEVKAETVRYIPIRLPEFLIKVESRLVMLIDEDSETALIWDWPLTATEPNCVLYVHPGWYGNAAFNAHKVKAIETVKSMRLEDNKQG